LNSYSSAPPDEFQGIRFCASSRFLRGLEKRHSLTSRRPPAEKRTEIDEAYARYFCDRTNALYKDCQRNSYSIWTRHTGDYSKLPQGFWEKMEGDGEIEIAYEREKVIYCFWRDHLQWK
jgi:hypothetical protein